MWQLTPEEAKERFAELIQAVLHGDTVQITTDRRVIQMTAVSKEGRRHFGSARGLVIMHEDFEAPIEDFMAYS